MIEDGCLDGVDEMWYPRMEYQPFGEVGVKSGPVMASATCLT